ncbi:MAG: hypothetical protein PHG30_04470 [Eubacteriales bacterium]|nr:hypothetical protein [Eubacteriales bacterium]
MERISELCEGKVSVVGNGRSVAAVMSEIVSSCSRDMPTIALCLEGTTASGLAGREDRIIFVGKNAGGGERLPDLLAPYLNSPNCGYEAESIVEALASVLLDSHSIRDGNDAYWTGSANRLFRGIMHSCLLGMVWERDFSFKRFVGIYQDLERWLPNMVQHDPGRNGSSSFVFPRESWSVPFLSRRTSHPLEELLANVHPSTAQITLNTYYSHTGSLHSVLKSLPGREGEGDYFSIADELEKTKGGVIFLVLSRELKHFSRCLFRFLLGGLTEIHAAGGGKALRVIVPDISQWKDVTGLGRIIEEASDNLSVVWGASDITGASSSEKDSMQTVVSLFARCDRRGWCRSSDPVAVRAYNELVPTQLRSYELTGIPEGMCMLQTPEGEFEGVAVPPLPVPSERSAISSGRLEGRKLWKDTAVREPEIREDSSDGELDVDSMLSDF